MLIGSFYMIGNGENNVRVGGERNKFDEKQYCDIVFLYPFPNIKDVSKFYKINFGTYMEGRSPEINWKDLKKQYKNLYKREIPLRSVYLDKYLKSGNVCDVGCSTSSL